MSLMPDGSRKKHTETKDKQQAGQSNPIHAWHCWLVLGEQGVIVEPQVRDRCGGEAKACRKQEE